MQPKHLTKPEESWIISLIKSAVGKVIISVVASTIFIWAGYAYAVYKFDKKIEEMNTTVISVVAANKELKNTQETILKNSSSTAVIDTIRAFRYDMKYIDMNVKDLQSDFIVFKAQYSEDVRETQHDIKELLKSKSTGEIPDTTFYPLTLSTN